MTKINIDEFDYIIIDCGYGGCFVEAHDEGILMDNLDDYHLISIHLYQFVLDKQSCFPVLGSKYYDEEEYYRIESVTGKDVFNDVSGKLVMCKNDRKKSSWIDIRTIVDSLGNKDLCSCLNMDSLIEVIYYEKDGIKIVEVKFDTEAG